MNKLKQDINGLTDIRTRNHTHAFWKSYIDDYKLS